MELIRFSEVGVVGCRRKEYCTKNEKQQHPKLRTLQKRSRRRQIGRIGVKHSRGFLRTELSSECCKLVGLTTDGEEDKSFITVCQ